MATISRVDLKRDPGPEADMPLTVSFSKTYFFRTHSNISNFFLNNICGSLNCLI